MKAIVRDDIIGLDSYVEAEFKYKRYLEVISESGGYCFIEQVERIWEDEDGRYLVQKMEDAKLVKTEYFSRYKYIRLTANALKYLYYRNSEKDFSGIPKNKIPIKNLKAKPTEKVLFSSVINFEFSQKNVKNQCILKNKHIEILERYLKIDNSIKIKELEKINEKTKVEYLKYEFAKKNQETIYERFQKKQSDLLNKVTNLQDEIKSLEEKTSFFNKNDTSIEKINEEIKILGEEISIIRIDLSTMSKVINERNCFANEYNMKLKEIEDLRKEEEDKNKLAQIIIDKLISIRDVSKMICIPFCKKNGDASIIIMSTFVKYHKSNYKEIIKDIFSFLSENNIVIKECRFYAISIFEPANTLTTAMEKIANYYNNANFSFGDFVFKWEMFKLTNLEKYFDTVSDKINFIKKNDVQQFEELKNKLT